MLIHELGRSIQADREREIQERLRQRGLLADATDRTGQVILRAANVGANAVRTLEVRPSSAPAHGRPR